MKRLSLLPQLIILSACLGRADAPASQDSVFGKASQTPGESALIGIFYDLKQTPDRKPTNIDAPGYFQAVEDFVNGGWDESILSKYYQVSTPRYTTQIFVPLIASEMAPAAFGVEKLVQGSYWIIHYKAQVVPPHDGTYRFVGWADVELEVAVNGQLALSGTYWDRPKFKMDFPIASAPGVEGRPLRSGPWMTLKASDPIDLDVLWGDDGGVCAAFLMVEEKGISYEMDHGYPLLPVFQVAPHPIPRSTPEKLFRTASTTSIWKAVQ